MSHFNSVFANSCVRVPIDPITKMPKTIYERKVKPILEQASIDSTSTTYSVIAPDVEAERLKEFYKSIPDYKDINHLSPDEFYSTLKILRDKKNKMLNRTLDDIDNYNGIGKRDDYETSFSKTNKTNNKTKIVRSIKRHISRKNDSKMEELKNANDITFDSLKVNKVGGMKDLGTKKDTIEFASKDELFEGSLQDRSTDKVEITKPKRNHSACSISWNDTCKVEGEEMDSKFARFFDNKIYDDDMQNKCRSMPSSPIRGRRTLSPCLRRRRSVTATKPFRMTERDEDERMVNKLRIIQKSLSEDMLHRKCDRKQFRAKPVPIESRIPLYDKILEDQAMRRAITKINSEAELRASMKPFSFTKREENSARGTPCERATHSIPKKKKKRFRARPVPKNLFSNYVYDKMKEDEFFRNLNRRIRAEEMLRHSALPSSMAARDSRLSTPAAHSDLPRDPSPIAPSATPSDRPRTRSPIKDRRKYKNVSREDFITTSPQPFTFNTADRAAKKLLDATKKIYEQKSNSSVLNTNSNDRVYSALDLRQHSTGRSNLAALLRVENVKRRFEMEASQRFAEQCRRADLRTRDRLLRSKPAWHLVRNNHEEDIAMRLQTRRDEERMRREEFLHEMELMYGRVRQQPLLFERYYAPRSLSAPSDAKHLSPRKTGKRISRKNNHYTTPNFSRKVSINETPETFNGAMADYLNRIENDWDSVNVTDSLDDK